VGYRVCCKPTHTNLYLNARSLHHSSNKQAELSTNRSRALWNEDSLHAKLVFLRDVFRQRLQRPAYSQCPQSSSEYQ
jgi:hypothetical protein